MVLLWMAFAFALLPSSIFAALHLFGAINWKVPAHGTSPERELSSMRLILTSWVGSVVGIVFAFVSLIFASEWDQIRYPERVRDGQGALAVIFSGPASWLVGGVLSIVGYRLFLCSSTERLWSAPWLYSGNRQIANRSVVSATFAVMLGSLFLCAFVLNWVLVHPGPW